MSKKAKLLAKLQSRSRSITWDEAVAAMTAHGFDMLPARGGGAARCFVHRATRVKARLHEPHPRNTMLDYMVDQLLEALKNAGEIGDEE